MTVPDEQPTEDRLDRRTINDVRLLLLEMVFFVWFFLHFARKKAHPAQCGKDAETFKNTTTMYPFLDLIF